MPLTALCLRRFCAILDGSKTGVTVKPDVYREHCQNPVWQRRCPAWKEAIQETDHLAENNQTNLKRPSSLPPFVMDHLRFKTIESKCNKELARIEAKLKHDGDVVVLEDKDLARPWRDAWARAATIAEQQKNPHMQTELCAIRDHVEWMYTKAKLKLHVPKSKKAQGNKAAKTFTDLPIERRQDVLRALSREFHSKPTGLLYFDAATVRRLKASYAYSYDYKTSSRKWSRFPWNVALRDLCEIKAEALGCPKTVAHDFYHWMCISPAYLRKHTSEES